MKEAIQLPCHARARKSPKQDPSVPHQAQKKVIIAPEKNADRSRSLSRPRRLASSGQPFLKDANDGGTGDVLHAKRPSQSSARFSRRDNAENPVTRQKSKASISAATDAANGRDAKTTAAGTRIRRASRSSSRSRLGNDHHDKSMDSAKSLSDETGRDAKQPRSGRRGQPPKITAGASQPKHPNGGDDKIDCLCVFVSMIPTEGSTGGIGTTTKRRPRKDDEGMPRITLVVKSSHRSSTCNLHESQHELKLVQTEPSKNSPIKNRDNQGPMMLTKPSSYGTIGSETTRRTSRKRATSRKHGADRSSSGSHKPPKMKSAPISPIDGGRSGSLDFVQSERYSARRSTSSHASLHEIGSQSKQHRSGTRHDAAGARPRTRSTSRPQNAKPGESQPQHTRSRSSNCMPKGYTPALEAPVPSPANDRRDDSHVLMGGNDSFIASPVVIFPEDLRANLKNRTTSFDTMMSFDSIHDWDWDGSDPPPPPPPRPPTRRIRHYQRATAAARSWQPWSPVAGEKGGRAHHDH